MIVIVTWATFLGFNSCVGVSYPYQTLKECFLLITTSGHSNTTVGEHTNLYDHTMKFQKDTILWAKPKASISMVGLHYGRRSARVKIFRRMEQLDWLQKSPSGVYTTAKTFSGGELQAWMKAWYGYQHGNNLCYGRSLEVTFLGQTQTLRQETWSP